MIDNLHCCTNHDSQQNGKNHSGTKNSTADVLTAGRVKPSTGGRPLVISPKIAVVFGGYRMERGFHPALKSKFVYHRSA